MEVQISSPLLKGKVLNGVLLVLLCRKIKKIKIWSRLLRSKRSFLLAAAASRGRQTTERHYFPAWFRRPIVERMLAYIDEYGVTKEFYMIFGPYLFLFCTFLIFVFNRLFYLYKKIIQKIKKLDHYFLKKLGNKKKLSFRDTTIRDILMVFRQILISCGYLLRKGVYIFVMFHIFNILSDHRK